MRRPGLNLWQLSLVFFVAIGVMLLCADAAHAKDTVRRKPLRWLPRIEARSGQVLVNAEAVIQLRTSAAGLEPEERAQLLANRLQEGLEVRQSVRAVRSSKHEATLVRGTQPLLTITRSDASGDPLPLAQRWASQLEAALRRPGLSLPVRTIVLPLRESRSLKIEGAAQGELQFLWGSEALEPTSNGDFCDVQAVGARGVERLILRGSKVGKGRLILQRDGAEVALDVKVQPYAAVIQPASPVTISGPSPSRELLRRLVLTHVKSAVRHLPGANVWIDETLPQLPRQFTESRAVSVPIKVSGAEMLPVQATVSVALQTTVPTPNPKPSVLLYSNAPERIEKSGPLYLATLPSSAQGARLLYHHQSHLKESVPFIIELLNPGTEPATVGLLWSQAGPVRDTVWVGFRAGRDFMQARRGGARVRMEVPPQSRLVLIQESLKPGMTISGLCELHQESGSPLQVQIRTLEAGATQAQVLSPLSEPLWSKAVERGKVSDETYSAVSVVRQASFSVGGPWRFIDLGKHAPICLTDASLRLRGDYGLNYEIEVELVNPTDHPQKVKLVFEAAAGLAGGAFFIDGSLVTIPQTNHLKEITLSRYQLAPQSRKTVRIETIPLSGSNYPARIIVREE